VLPSPTGTWVAAGVLAALLAPAGVAAGAPGVAVDAAVADAAAGAPGVVENIGAESEAGAPGVVEDAAVAAPADAYHLSAWRDGRYDALYTEWWYFNFQDARAGVGAIFSYFVTNPLDIRGVGRAQMVAVAYTAQGTVTAIDAYPPAAFSADESDVRVSIDPGAPGVAPAGMESGAANTVRADPDGLYHIAGASRDGRIAWDLAYAPAAEPWYAAEAMPVGRLAWEKMSWLVEMPRARVTGMLTVDGRAVAIDATGYHDHNWGEWIPTDATWNWAQYSSPRLSLEMGDFIGKPVGVVALDLDGTRTVFTPDQYSLVHTRWAWDRVNRLFYPSESVLSADNGTLRVQVTMRALATEPLRGDLPAPLRDLIIYEQTARFEGTVWGRGPGGNGRGNSNDIMDNADPTGEWHVLARLRGTGFKEWTGKRF
jgi:hypothetical protein